MHTIHNVQHNIHVASQYSWSSSSSSSSSRVIPEKKNTQTTKPKEFSNKNQHHQPVTSSSSWYSTPRHPRNQWSKLASRRWEKWTLLLCHLGYLGFVERWVSYPVLKESTMLHKKSTPFQTNLLRWVENTVRFCLKDWDPMGWKSPWKTTIFGEYCFFFEASWLLRVLSVYREGMVCWFYPEFRVRCMFLRCKGDKLFLKWGFSDDRVCWKLKQPIWITYLHLC